MATKIQADASTGFTGADVVKARKAQISATATPVVADIGGTNPATPQIENVAPVQPTVAPAMVVPEGMKDTPVVAPKEPVQPPVIEQPKQDTSFMTDVQRREKLGQVDQQASRDQMIANVGIMAKEDPATLTDRAKFEAKTGYQGKSQEEKAILDQYFTANTPKTAEEIKRQLSSGVSITDRNILNTPQYRQAKFEMNRLSKYNAMSPEQLLNEMKSGIPTNISSQLVNSPAYQQAKQKYDDFKKVDSINKASEFLVTGANKGIDPLTQLSEQLTQIFSGQDQTGSTAEAYKSFISENPEIVAQTQEYNQKMAQKKEFERAREQIVGDLKKKYAGEPLSTILAIAARDSEPINKQIEGLNDSLTTLGADIRFKTDLATQEFGFFQEDQKVKAAKQAKLQDLLGGLAVSQFGRQQDQAFTRETQAQNQAFDLQKMDIQQKFQSDRDTQNYIQDLQKMGVANVYDLQKLSANQDFQKELLSLNQKYENSRSVRDFQNDITKMGFQFDMQQRGKALDLTNEKEMLSYKASLDPDLAAKWEEVRAKATENSSLADLYGKNVGTYEGNRGYDLAGKLGDAIVSPPGARVIEVNALNPDGTVSIFKDGGVGQAPVGMSGKDKGWGNSVVLQLPDGKYMRLSHLQDIGVNVGSELPGGAVVGTRGNTGNVKGKNGETLTPEQKAAGRGAHVDVEISNDASFSKSGLLNQNEQLTYLKSVKPFGTNKQTDNTLDAGNISYYNSVNPTSLKGEEKEKYKNVQNQKSAIMKDPNANIQDVIAFSAGGKDMTDGQIKSLEKFSSALDQIQSLQGNLSKSDTGPIIGRLKSANPYDSSTQAIKAQIQGLIPTVARGVFGEVGVLTDQDIENYKKTVPNLTSTEDTNKLIMGIMLDTLANGYKRQLQTFAGSGRDVSGLAGMYESLKSQSDFLRAEITNKQDTPYYLKNF